MNITLRITLLAVLFLAFMGVSPAVASNTTNPLADSTVKADSPDTNNGTNTYLRTDGSPVWRSYLKFTVSGMVFPATTKLRVYATASLTAGISVAASDTSWTETGITYNNAPAPGTAFVSTGALTANTWVEIDVSSQIFANSTYGFVLLPNASTQGAFSSKEGSYPPELVVTGNHDVVQSFGEVGGTGSSFGPNDIMIMWAQSMSFSGASEPDPGTIIPNFENNCTNCTNLTHIFGYDMTIDERYNPPNSQNLDHLSVRHYQAWYAGPFSTQPTIHDLQSGVNYFFFRVRFDGVPSYSTVVSDHQVVRDLTVYSGTPTAFDDTATAQAPTDAGTHGVMLSGTNFFGGDTFSVHYPLDSATNYTYDGIASHSAGEFYTLFTPAMANAPKPGAKIHFYGFITGTVTIPLSLEAWAIHLQFP